MNKHVCFWMRRCEGFFYCRCGAEMSIGANFGTVIDGEVFIHKPQAGAE